MVQLKTQVLDVAKPSSQMPNFVYGWTMSLRRLNQKYEMKANQQRGADSPEPGPF